MPRIGRTTASIWHFLGECSCGNFEYQDLVEEQAFDETAYDGTPDPDKDDPENENPPYGEYRDFCRQCYSLIEQWNRTRSSRIEAIVEEQEAIRTEWKRGEHDPRKQALPDCALCDKPESGTSYNDSIDRYACDACRTAFNEAVQRLDSAEVPKVDTASLASITDQTDPLPTTQTRTQSNTDGTPVSRSSSPGTPSSSTGPTDDTNTDPLEHNLETAESVVDSDDRSDRSSGRSTTTRHDEKSSGSLDELLTVSGVGPGILETLRTHGYRSKSDLEATTPETLAELPQIGTALSERLSTVAEVGPDSETTESSTQEVLDELQGVPGVGEKVIVTLCEHGYSSPEEVASTSSSELQALPRIGETVATRLTNESPSVNESG